MEKILPNQILLNLLLLDIFSTFFRNIQLLYLPVFVVKKFQIPKFYTGHLSVSMVNFAHCVYTNVKVV